MFRFALILLMSLAVSSQAVAAVKWNNSNSSKIKLWNTGEQFRCASC